jgi:hypothetical protein
MSIIYKNSNGDTRTAPKNVTFKEFQKANDMHREDVKNTMNEIAFLLMEKGKKHDWTKKDYEEMFYNNFLSTLNNGTNFVEDEWYQLHIEKEKHHLFSKCHDDVDLLDVIEMVVDCVCAGKARSGEIRGLEINQEILDKALKNTVKKINEMVKCEE